MTSTIPNNDVQDFVGDEFLDPNENYGILLIEMRERLLNLQHDIPLIEDPEVKGFAQKVYTELKLEYFSILTSDMTLQCRMRTQYAIENLKLEVDKNEQQ